MRINLTSEKDSFFCDLLMPAYCYNVVVSLQCARVNWRLVRMAIMTKRKVALFRRGYIAALLKRQLIEISLGLEYPNKSNLSELIRSISRGTRKIKRFETNMIDYSTLRS